MLLSNGDVSMLPDTFSEEFNETRLELTDDADDVDLNLNPVQQYLVFAMANRDDPDVLEGALID